MDSFTFPPCVLDVVELEGELTGYYILFLSPLLVIGSSEFSVHEARNLLSFAHYVEPSLSLSLSLSLPFSLSPFLSLSLYIYHFLKISNSAKFAVFAGLLGWYAVSTGT